MNQIRIGISGWNYPLWKKTFYPADLSVKKEFDYAVARFSTIEVNGTFYRLQKPATFRSWYENSPPGTVFAIKGNRFITHAKRLNHVTEALSNFFATGVLELKEKLGPILWQFPPNMKFDEVKFREFFRQLPRTPQAAVRLARQHNMRIAGDDEPLKAHKTAKLRYAVEIRHDSFNNLKFFELLKEFNIAYVIADTAGRWMYSEEVTADFVYIRLHGFKELYSGGYTTRALTEWSNKIRTWQGRGRKARDIFVYFDNDAKVNAPFDAASLLLKLKDEKSAIFPIEDPKELISRRSRIKQKKLLELQDRAKHR